MIQGLKSEMRIPEVLRLNLLRGRLALTRLGRKELRVDVRQHTTLGDGHTAQELVELLIVSDSQLQMTGHNLYKAQKQVILSVPHVRKALQNNRDVQGSR